MEIKDVLVYTEQHEFVKGDISFEDGIIKEVSALKNNGAEADADDDLYDITGLVDIDLQG